MDRENSGSNISDMLKLLKDTVENTPNAENIDAENAEAQSAENMNTELLKESLRSKFMSDDDDVLKLVEQSDEYAIDESFVSEGEEEPEEEETIIEEASEEDEEDVEEEISEEPEEEPANVGEDYYTESEDTESESADGIIEIAIPWVDSIPEGDPQEEEELDDEDDEDESGFVMFADGNYSDDTDDFDGMEDDEADEEFDEEIGEEIDDEIEEESAEVINADSAPDEAESADDDDDVPWFDTPDRNFVEEETEVFLSGAPTEETVVSVENEPDDEPVTEEVIDETIEETV